MLHMVMVERITLCLTALAIRLGFRCNADLFEFAWMSCGGVHRARIMGF